MYPARAARELGVLLRISRELDVVGDLTAVVDNPSELLAWAHTLTDPAVTAWRAADSGSRYLEVSATHNYEPIRGQATAVLHCEHHPAFWRALSQTHDLKPGDRTTVTIADLARAWEAMPITPPA